VSARQDERGTSSRPAFKIADNVTVPVHAAGLHLSRMIGGEIHSAGCRGPNECAHRAIASVPKFPDRPGTQNRVHFSYAFTAAGPGIILGTAAHMSPEQAKGKESDRTSDIWAFGCVLYEMLTARTVFQGETANEIFAAVLRAEPDWHWLPMDTPEGIRRLLRRCLVKSQKQRLPHIGVACIEINEVQRAGH
jgi:serine/threonine protein kinase